MSGAGSDPAAGLQPILARDNDPRAGGEALLDHRCAVRSSAPTMTGCIRRRSIRLDDVDVHAVRSALHRGGGHVTACGKVLQQQADIDVLAGPQGVILVGKRRLEAHAAGRLVDLVVDEPAAARELPLIVAALSNDLERRRFDGSSAG